jgi:chromosomal replication initiation ATPase DnaA
MDNDYSGSRQGDPTVRAIERAVAYFFGMSVEELHRKSSMRAVTVPRQIAMYLMKRTTEASVQDIGRHFGNRHPSSVGRTIAKLEEQRSKMSAVDLVICELLNHPDLKLALKRKRVSGANVVSRGQSD